MVTSVTKRRYGAERRGGGSALLPTPGKDGRGMLGRASARCWEHASERVLNAAEVLSPERVSCGILVSVLREREVALWLR